jgi:hypothetical protein
MILDPRLITSDAVLGDYLIEVGVGVVFQLSRIIVLVLLIVVAFILH